jgi:hypothetical protein
MAGILGTGDPQIGAAIPVTVSTRPDTPIGVSVFAARTVAEELLRPSPDRFTGTIITQGTVSATQTGITVQVSLDGDSAAIACVAFLGAAHAVGQRVIVMLISPSSRLVLGRIA